MANIFESDGTVWIKEEPLGVYIEEEEGSSASDYYVKTEADCEDDAVPPENSTYRGSRVKEEPDLEIEDFHCTRRDLPDSDKSLGNHPSTLIERPSDSIKNVLPEPASEGGSNSTETKEKEVAQESPPPTKRIRTTEDSGSEKVLLPDLRSLPFMIDRRLKCKVCDFISETPSDLRTHMIHDHTDVKILLCPECEYTTKTSTRLKNHIMAKHTKEKPLSCPFCDYCTIQTSNLKNHITARHANLRAPDPKGSGPQRHPTK